MTQPLSFFLFAYWHDPRWKLFVGASVKIRDLAINLAAMGHQVTLFLPKYGFSEKELPVTVIEIPLLNVPGLRSLSFNVLLLFFLIRRWRSLQPDIVYLRRTSLITPLLFAAMKRARFFLEVNDDPFVSRREEGSRIRHWARSFLSEALDRINIRSADRCFVISGAVIEKIKRRMPAVPPGKMIIMPSGANTDLMRPMDKEDACRQIGLDGSHRYIGFAGTLLAHQGLGHLIEAASAIIKAVPAARFLIVGDGPMKKTLQEQTRAKKLKNFFIFTGEVDYEFLPLWINAMDVCVAPYCGDAGLRSPVKIFDYLACGKSIVASNVPGITGIFKDAPLVSLVTPDSPVSLARVICEAVVPLPPTKEERGAACQWIRERFDRRMTAKLVADEAAAMATPTITVLHVIGSAGFGGGERYLLDLIRFSSRPFRHVAAVPYAGPLSQSMDAAGNTCRIINMPLRPSISGILGLRRFNREAGADIIHSHGFRANLYGRLAALITGKPHVATIHVSLYDYRETAPARRRLYRCVEKWSSPITRRFICISEAMATDTRKLGIKADKIVVIGNGVDPERFSGKYDCARIKKRFGIYDQGPVIGTVGRMVAEKGQVHLIRALSVLKSDFPDLVCLFVGEGSLLEYLKQETLVEGVSDMCRFTGPVAEIEAVYPVLDLFVLPSLREPFGLSLLEAMASGVTVLATDSGGPSEYIRSGVNGLLVPPGNPQAMAEGIKKILSDQTLRKVLAGEGKRTVTERFNVRKTAEKIGEVYSSCLYHIPHMK